MRVHTLDLNILGTPGIIAAFLLECGPELALVETGPGSTLPALLAGIRGLGFDPAAIRHVFVTHIHLDHAGAAGWWAQQGARIYCHPNAARHLISPARLMESATAVYGDQMDRLWGEMLPAPAELVTALKDGETVTVGDCELTALDTPGHTRHHHAFACGDVCFTGDVAGMRLEQSAYLSVTAAPPQFEPEPYVASVERLKALDFRVLYLTHFGVVTNVSEHLTTYQDRIREVDANVRGWVKEGCDAEEIRRRYTEAEHHDAMQAGLSEACWELYKQGNGPAMCADGVRLSVERNPG